MSEPRSPSVSWFDHDRVPAGDWIFLSTIWNSLRLIQSDVLVPSVDLTEGLDRLTISGCMEAYRQIIVRRVLDLAQATAVTWNAGLAIGAVVSARGLLETLAVFHDLMAETVPLAERKDWDALSAVVDAYAFSTSNWQGQKSGIPQGPPKIGAQVRRFIRVIEPDAERFWHQISDIAHPNGKPMFAHFGRICDQRFDERPASESEAVLFQAIYNCLYAVCWFFNAMGDFDQLLDRIRYLDPEPDGATALA